MRFRWILPFRQKDKDQKKDRRFQRSLVRNVVTALLLTSLIPLLIIGVLNVFRSRELLRKQVSQQTERIVAHEVAQVQEYADLRSAAIDRLVHDENFLQSLNTLLTTSSSSKENADARSVITYSFHGNPLTAAEQIFDQMFVLRPDSAIALATDPEWIIAKFGNLRVQDPYVRALIGTNKSVFTFETLSDGAHRLVLYTTRTIVDSSGAPQATIIATTQSTAADATFRTIAYAGDFLQDAKSYYFTPEAALLGVDNDTLQKLPENEAVQNAILPLIGKTPAPAQFSVVLNGEKTIAYAYWLPTLELGLLLAAPEPAILQPGSLIDPINLVVLLLSLLISGGLIYYSSTQLVTPLVRLSQAADNFSKGQWSERATIDRDDEVGLLAYSFNQMADALGQLYQSVESAIEGRTATLRAASEVAQMATSSIDLTSTLNRTVALIVERFGFYHVAIYLYDAARQNLVLEEASGVAGKELKQRGDRIDITANTLISWVAANHTARIIRFVNEDELFRSDELLPDTHSEIAVPILLGAEVIGVLDIQSTLADAFSDETSVAFQTLANQISSTLQATRSLAATQASFEETSLLYAAAQKVSQAKNTEEVFQAVTSALLRTPWIGAILSVEKENFKILALTDPTSDRVDRSLQTLNIPTGQMVHRLEQNRVVLLQDISQSSEYDTLVSFLLRRACKSAALLPILENGQLTKVLVLSTVEADRLSHADLQPYQNLADVISAAMEKFSALSSVQARLDELQILASFSQAISAEVDLSRLYHVLHEQIKTTFGEDLEFSVATYNAKNNFIEFPYYFEENQVRAIEPMQLGQGLTSHIIESRQPLLLNTEQEIRALNPRIEGQVSRSWVGVPLVFANTVVGAILIQDLRHEHRFAPGDLHLLTMLAPQIATAIRNTQLYTETQQALKAYDQERFLLDKLLNATPDKVSFKDSHGRYIRASSSAASSLQISAEDMVGKTDFDLIERSAAEKTFLEERMVMTLGKPEIGLIQHKTGPSGAETWADISQIPIRTSSGDPYGLLVIQRDITALKQAEELSQRRAGQVLTAAEIARDATGTLDVDALLQKSVNLVRERFGFYHASVFLIDAPGDYAVLRASTGTAGQEMLRAGHRLAIGSKSIVGQAAQSGEPLIVNNVTSDPTHLPNPLLPDTHSELAIPLKVGQRILGALDVQSTQTDAFQPEDLRVLGILADQLAVALINANLFAKTQELLAKHRLLRQISIQASSASNLEDVLSTVINGLLGPIAADRIAFLLLDNEGMLQVQASAGYEGAHHQGVRIAPGQGVIGKAALTKQPVRVDGAPNDVHMLQNSLDVRSQLAIPILFSATLLGVLNIESKAAYAFDENDQEILSALGNNLGGVIANIRLVSQAQQQVLRERQLFEITSKVRRSVDLGTILETSAQEIAQALGARRASIRITGAAQGAEILEDWPASQQGPAAGSGNGRHNESKNGQEVNE